MRRATPGREARQQPAPRARLQPIAQVMPARAAARARRSPRAPQPARRSQRAAARATQPPHRSPRRPSAEHTACPCPSRTRRRDEHMSGGSQCTCCFVSVARRVGGLASVVAAHTGVGAATCGRTAEQVCGAVGRGSPPRRSSSQQRASEHLRAWCAAPTRRPARVHARPHTLHARTPCPRAHRCPHTKRWHCASLCTSTPSPMAPHPFCICSSRRCLGSGAL